MNAHYTMDMALTKELQRLRQQQTNANVGEGMAWVFRILPGVPGDQPIGMFTVVFAEAWCAGDPAYRWERV